MWPSRPVCEEKGDKECPLRVAFEARQLHGTGKEKRPLHRHRRLRLLKKLALHESENG
jgi:hypothetical protein